MDNNPDLELEEIFSPNLPPPLTLQGFYYDIVPSFTPHPPILKSQHRLSDFRQSVN
jgi:hypothetical protein